MKKQDNSRIKIRLANPGDAIAIADLLYYSFVECQLHYTAEAFAATTPGVEEIKNRIQKHMVWVALYDNVIAGTVSLISKGDSMLIKSVAVAPSARRKGLGNCLMMLAEDTAVKRGTKYLELTTTPFLHEAIGLYERFGFEQCGYDELYDTPLIKMAKNLDLTPISSGEEECNSTINAK